MERTIGRAASSPTPNLRRQGSFEPRPQLSQESGENLLAFFRILTEWAAADDVRAPATGASPQLSQVSQ
jgi:hypothetical protein